MKEKTMKKFDFKKLALMGITGGVMCATQVNGDTSDMSRTSSSHKTSVLSGAKLDEPHFLAKLNADNKVLYNKMTQEGRALALKLANPDGSKPPEFTDPNDAVKEAQKRMDDQRAKPKSTTPIKK
jgi:hypothetical protein